MSDLKTLPWPFPEEDRSLRYAVNVQPAPQNTKTLAGSWGEHVVDLGDDYSLTFIGCQVPDDILLLTERDNQLWFDAALVTSSADWSVKFDMGMSFDEIHVPVPGLTAGSLTGLAQSFLRMLTTEQVYRRVNWTLSAVGSRLRDTSLETMPQWMYDMPELVAQKDWGRLQLRIDRDRATGGDRRAQRRRRLPDGSDAVAARPESGKHRCNGVAVRLQSENGNLHPDRQRRTAHALSTRLFRYTAACGDCSSGSLGRERAHRKRPESRR